MYDNYVIASHLIIVVSGVLLFMRYRVFTFSNVIFSIMKVLPIPIGIFIAIYCTDLGEQWAVGWSLWTYMFFFGIFTVAVLFSFVVLLRIRFVSKRAAKRNGKQ